MAGSSAEGRGVDLSGGGAGAPITLSGPGGGPLTGPSDLRVQIAAQAATTALQDPEVQRQMKETAKEYAGHAVEVGKRVSVTAYHELHKYVQEGPAGVSVLCFLGGLATTAVGAIGVLSIFSVVLTPFEYILNCYLTLFGVVAVLLEADVERLSQAKVIGKLARWVEQYQAKVFVEAKFLTQLRGRGLFYLFVGTLAITQCIVCPLFVIGAWNLAMGLICLLMSFGINPTEHLPRVDGDGSHAGGQDVPLAGFTDLRTPMTGSQSQQTHSTPHVDLSGGL